jgi:hypothetical protein
MAHFDCQDYRLHVPMSLPVWLVHLGIVKIDNILNVFLYKKNAEHTALINKLNRQQYDFVTYIVYIINSVAEVGKSGLLDSALAA